jgi:integrase
MDDVKRVSKGANTHGWQHGGTTVCVGVYKNGKYTRGVEVYYGSGSGRIKHPQGPFKTEHEADEAAKVWVKQIAEHRTPNLTLSKKAMDAVVSAIVALKARDITLIAAVNNYIRLLDAVPKGWEPMEYYKKVNDLVVNRRLLDTDMTVTVEEVVARFLKTKSKENGKVLNDWEWVLLSFAKEIKGKFYQVKMPQIANWLDEFKTTRARAGKKAGEPISKGTRQRVHTKIIALFDQAILWGYIPRGENPATDIKRVSKKQARSSNRSNIGIYSLIDICQLLRKIDRDFLIVVELVALGGLRNIEAYRIKWEDIFRIPDYIDINQEVAAKNGDDREILIFPMLSKRLEKYRKPFEEGKLTGRVMGSRFPNLSKDEANFTRHLGVAIKKIVGDRFAANGLRHTYGSYLYPQLGNRDLLSNFMGNSDGMLFKHYVRKGVKMPESRRFIGLATSKSFFDRGMKHISPLLRGQQAALRR